jgi:O2-independent ubiquinone biosynthesis protein UbiV
MTDTNPALRIALGPLLYYWPREQVLAFYEAARAWPVDVVYLGEAVCGKRHEMRPDDWLAIARELTAAGKEVVLSTCELLESEGDLRVMRRIATNGEFTVEANDLGAVRMLAGRVPFVAGPYLTAYSRHSLDVFRDAGAMRWVAPIEMSRDGLREVLSAEASGIQTEVFAYGRLPLAISARCFTARYHNVSRDDCGFRCIEHPDGMLVSTQDDEPFLVVNGLQTQSARVQDLCAEVPAMRALGVNVLRLSPQATHMGEIAATFRGVADGTIAPAAAVRSLSAWAPADLCDGYWHGRPGQERAGRTTLAVAAR